MDLQACKDLDFTLGITIYMRKACGLHTPQASICCMSHSETGMLDKFMDGQTTDVDADFASLQERVRGSNIDEQTLLATDYLNHFNEVVMLLQMVPDMPEILDEAKAWAPKSYEDHFRDSTVADKDLAIEVYPHVPTNFKLAFEQTIDQLNRLVAVVIDRLERLIEQNDPDQLRMVATESARSIERLMDIAGGIIHGNAKTMDQAEIDALLQD